MSNAFTDTTALGNLVQTAFDRAVNFYLNDTPFFRDIATKRVEHQTAPGKTVTLFKHVKIAAQTTPLTEAVDPDAVAYTNPTTVNVTMNEYGMATLTTNLLNVVNLADTLEMDKVHIIGDNMRDTLDALVQAIAFAGTNVMRKASAAYSNTAAQNTVASTDILDAKGVVIAVQKLRGRKVSPIRGTSYAAYVHPDVSADVMTDTGANGWVIPKNYVDTSGVYRGEIGTFRGAAFIESPRCPIVAGGGASSANVYQTLFVGSEALAELNGVEPHVVVGNQTDKLKRFWPLGWYGLLGWARFREEALTRVETASSIGALT